MQPVSSAGYFNPVHEWLPSDCNITVHGDWESAHIAVQHHIGTAPGSWVLLIAVVEFCYH